MCANHPVIVHRCWKVLVLLQLMKPLKASVLMNVYNENRYATEIAEFTTLCSQVVKNHKVVSDDGKGKMEFEVEFDAQWRFWKVSGYCAIPLRMHLDKSTGEVRLYCVWKSNICLKTLVRFVALNWH